MDLHDSILADDADKAAYVRVRRLRRFTWHQRQLQTPHEQWLTELGGKILAAIQNACTDTGKSVMNSCKAAANWLFAFSMTVLTGNDTVSVRRYSALLGFMSGEQMRV